MAGIISQDLLTHVLYGAQTIFNNTFQAALDRQIWSKLVYGGKAIDSSGEEAMIHKWMGQVPVMERFQGAVNLGGVNPYSLTVTNFEYAAGFPVQRIAIERDKYGEIEPKTRQLAEEAARHPGGMTFTLLNNGTSVSTTTPVFDGLAFFADTRTIGASGNIDNLMAQTGTDVGDVRTDINAGVARMMTYCDDVGRPLGWAPNLLVCHSNMFPVVWEVMNIGNGSTEPSLPPAGSNGLAMFETRGWTVISSPLVSDTTGLYLFHNSPLAAPFGLQEEFPARLEGVTSPNTDSAVINRRFVYTVVWSGAVFYLDPRAGIYIT